jgi:hypothetical protein
MVLLEVVDNPQQVDLVVQDQMYVQLWTRIPNSGVYAGGGGGGTFKSGTAGTGGAGGGGSMLVEVIAGTAGTANTGGGGGGAWSNCWSMEEQVVQDRYRKRIKQGQWIVATESTI